MVESGSIPPLALIVDDEPINREFAAKVLSATGWAIATAASGEEALAMLSLRPALILMDLCMDGMTGFKAVAAIRGREGAEASVPIIAFTTTRVADVALLHADGFDGLLPKPCTPDELTATAARWRPDGAVDVLDRLEEGLGVAEIGAMTLRFRDLLMKAIVALDGEDDMAGLAHRVAGIAGTLGFAAVGHAWLALSHGKNDAVRGARREARRAIAAIDRRRNADRDATSV